MAAFNSSYNYRNLIKKIKALLSPILLFSSLSMLLFFCSFFPLVFSYCQDLFALVIELNKLKKNYIIHFCYIFLKAKLSEIHRD